MARGSFRKRVLRVVAAAAVGGGCGSAVFALNRVDTGYAFAVTGVAAGAAFGLAMDLYRRTVRLTEVRISVPQLSELTFVVNNDTKQISWQLFVESVTRVSTQSLGGEGLLREALTSLYGLFSTVRDVLRAASPTSRVQGVTVEYLAVRLLNRELRPFLSRWHPRLGEFEAAHPELPESAWPEAAQCRAELVGLQARCRGYVLGFARLAGVEDPELMLDGLGSDTGQAPGA